MGDIIAASEGAWVPFETTLHFDWATPPLSLNRRYPHPDGRRRIITETRAAAASAAARIPDVGRCRVTLTWFVTDKRIRNVENLADILNALCDGLVDAGVVVDDRPEYMDKAMPRIEWVDKKLGHAPHIELHVERLEQL